MFEKRAVGASSIFPLAGLKDRQQSVAALLLLLAAATAARHASISSVLGGVHHQVSGLHGCMQPFGRGSDLICCGAIVRAQCIAAQRETACFGRPCCAGSLWHCCAAAVADDERACWCATGNATAHVHAENEARPLAATMKEAAGLAGQVHRSRFASRSEKFDSGLP
jgi:hypothetical protein